ncbi:LAFA_0E14268g1_1 [Lachancea sp. 'fantastica']|nr:LAFA_0E14268g1_1 [Lachancea sp. 'fantastica']
MLTLCQASYICVDVAMNSGYTLICFVLCSAINRIVSPIKFIRMLPRINTLLQQYDPNSKRSISEPCSPSLRPLAPIRPGSFTANVGGVITLPPLQLAPLQRSASPQILATPVSTVKRAQSCCGSIENSPAPQRMATPSSLAKTPQPDSRKAFAFISHSQETFPSKEPSIDNAPLARRKRRRTSKRELNILQSEFERCATPDKQTRLQLSESCSMSEKAIQIWFQNKRQSVKRHEKNGAAANSSGHTTDGDESAEPQSPLIANSFTPVSVRTSSSSALTGNPKTPPLAILDTSNIVLDTVTPHGDSTPTKQSIYTSQQTKRGQALTFRLKTDNKTMTPIKTSPNNRVNKLINGHNQRSPKGTKGLAHNLNTTPLRSLDINAIRN